MASYDVQTRNGSVVAVPDFSMLNIDGLQIIGDQTQDWNEPYNKNFLVLDKKIMSVENLIANIETVEMVDIANTFDEIKIELVSIKSSINSNEYDDSILLENINLLNTKLDSLVISFNSKVDSKVDKVLDKQLSSEDFTTADKTKLAVLSNYTKPTAEPISYITGLQTVLDTKATEVYVSSLVESKANTNHKHNIIDVNGLDSELATKISFTSANTLDLGEM